jgi:hypothetical protein
MAMVISALDSGVRSVRGSEEVHRVPVKSLECWVEKNGRPSWTELKELHGPPAPKKKKKRKAVAKTGEKQTKKGK